MIAATAPVQFAADWQAYLNRSWRRTHMPYRVDETRCKPDGVTVMPSYRCISQITDRRRQRTVCVEAVVTWDGYQYLVWGRAKVVVCRGAA